MTESEWKERYAERLMAWGWTKKDATLYALAAEFIEDIDPEDSADDELSYWAEDSA